MANPSIDFSKPIPDKQLQPPAAAVSNGAPRLTNDLDFLMKPGPGGKSELDRLIEQQRKAGGKGTRAVIDKRFLWRNGQTLRVSFHRDCDPGIVERVKPLAATWTKHADLNFDFVGHDASADIRVTFVQQGPFAGHHSLVGTQSSPKGDHQPSMNLMLNANTTDEEFHHVVLHEFGHSIGFLHEHSSPATGGPQWNEAAVIRYFQMTQNPPWSPQQTRDNILNRAQLSTSSFTEFDPSSIMIYTFGPDLMLDGRSFKRNAKLSRLDMQLARETYPGRPASSDDGSGSSSSGGDTGGGDTGSSGGGDQADITPAQALSLNTPTDGKIERPNQVRVYTFSASAGERHTVEVKAGSATDLQLSLSGPDDPTANVMQDGPSTNPVIAGTLQAGEYTVTVTIFKGGKPGSFRIAVNV